MGHASGHSQRPAERRIALGVMMAYVGGVVSVGMLFAVGSALASENYAGAAASEVIGVVAGAIAIAGVIVLIGVLAFPGAPDGRSRLIAGLALVPLLAGGLIVAVRATEDEAAWWRLDGCPKSTPLDRVWVDDLYGVWIRCSETSPFNASPFNAVEPAEVGIEFTAEREWFLWVDDKSGTPVRSLDPNKHGTIVTLQQQPWTPQYLDLTLSTSTEPPIVRVITVTAYEDPSQLVIKSISLIGGFVAWNGPL